MDKLTLSIVSIVLELFLRDWVEGLNRFPSLLAGQGQAGPHHTLQVVGLELGWVEGLNQLSIPIIKI